MKRHLKEKERALLEKLKTYERTRTLHRENRKRHNLKTVGIVGYTNAGKSSLFNTLTHK
ncbi:MAG: GTPase [Patescibacteria group bacterium]